MTTSNNHNLKNEKSDINLKESIKILEPKNIKKFALKDPEKILYDNLYAKFGERFVEYRKRYERNVQFKDLNEETDYPNTIIMELVNRCNLECPFCKQWFRNDAKKTTIDDHILDHLFDDFKKNQLNSIMISASEPLLYKKINKVLDRAREAEIMDVFLFTNGILLNEKNARMVLDSPITRLFISVDGATKETYDKVRIPVAKRLYKTNRLEDLENNILRFMKLRSELKRELPLVRLSFLAINENKEEIQEFVNKWTGIVDTVEIQKNIAPSFEMNTKNEKENIEDWYKTLGEEMNTKNRITDHLKKYSCREPWSQMSIYSDGSILPCCATFGRNIPIGSIHNETVKEAWNGLKMKRIRDGFKKNKPNKVCRACLDHTTTVTNDIL